MCVCACVRTCVRVLRRAALRDDLYYDVGCLLALCLVHRAPPIRFFSPALYQCLFNYPPNQPLAVGHMTPNTYFSRQVDTVRSRRAAGMGVMQGRMER